MEKLQREIIVSYNGKDFNVKFPNVGQMIDIESLKNAMTGGRYGSFAASGIKSMYFVLDMVDTISFFSVMCPQIKKMIPQENLDTDYTKMNPENVKELITLYKKSVLPWYSKLLKDLYSISNENTESAE